MIDGQLFTFDPQAAIVPDDLGAPVAPRIVSQGGRRLPGPAAGGLAAQFMLFGLSKSAEGPAILDAADVEPELAGSHEQADVQLSTSMQCFHVGRGENIDANTKATLRVNIGQDPNSPATTPLDTLFWSIAAGLQLFDEQAKAPPKSADLKGDFSKALGHRPVEVPGGLATLSFQVVKHKDPAWWKKLFRFATSGTGERLVSLLGFPAITLQAIEFLDGLLSRLLDEEPEVILGGRPMRLALSQYAKHSYTGGSARVRVGSLNPGFSVLTRGRDAKVLADAEAVYYPHLGRLLPEAVDPADALRSDYEDDLDEITYAVLRVGMRSIQLAPALDFG